MAFFRTLDLENPLKKDFRSKFVFFLVKMLFIVRCFNLKLYRKLDIINISGCFRNDIMSRGRFQTMPVLII